MSDRSLRSRRGQHKALPPSALQYYIGYVDDDESPEEIERRFKELERLEQEVKTHRTQIVQSQQHSITQKDADQHMLQDSGTQNLFLRSNHNTHQQQATTGYEKADANDIDWISKQMLLRTKPSQAQYIMAKEAEKLVLEECESSSDDDSDDEDFRLDEDKSSNHENDLYEEDVEIENLEPEMRGRGRPRTKRSGGRGTRHTVIPVRQSPHQLEVDLDDIESPISEQEDSALQELYSLLKGTRIGAQFGIHKKGEGFVAEDPLAVEIERFDAQIPETIVHHIASLSQIKVYQSGTATITVFDDSVPSEDEKRIHILANDVRGSPEPDSDLIDDADNDEGDDLFEEEVPKTRDSGTNSESETRVFEPEYVGCYLAVASVLKHDYAQLGRHFETILLDPPYDRLSSIDQLRALPIEKPWFFPRGYLYIWVEKEFITDMVDLASDWGLEYVDNVIWVKKSTNNTFVLGEYPFFARSKTYLFIFRKDNEQTKSMQIRHQRNADVIFDFIKDDPSEKPQEYAYRVAETLVPSSLVAGKCLELWGKPNGKHRAGWTKIVDADGII